MEEIISKHASDKNVVALLQSIQQKYGFIPEKEAAEIARRLDIPLNKLWGVATFYSQFKLKQRGKYLLQVCNGTACHVNHSAELIDFVKSELKINPGESTPDSKFTFELVNCIGACARSPAVMINGTVYGLQTPEKLRKIIDGLKNG